MIILKKDKSHGARQKGACDFLSLALKRKTTYEFSDKKVKKKDIKKILEAARWAPSCSNVQPWNFIVVEEREKIRALIDCASFGVFHTDPPVVIAIMLDSSCWSKEDHRCVVNDKLGIMEAYLCISTCASNMIFEAESLGINTSLLTPHLKEASKILQVRPEDSVHLLVCVGYEKKGAYQKIRERKDLNKLVYKDYFGGKYSL